MKHLLLNDLQQIPWQFAQRFAQRFAHLAADLEHQLMPQLRCARPTLNPSHALLHNVKHLGARQN